MLMAGKTPSMEEHGELSPEELSAQHGDHLPDREAMSLLRVLPDGGSTFEPVLPEEAADPAPQPMPVVEES